MYNALGQTKIKFLKRLANKKYLLQKAFDTLKETFLYISSFKKLLETMLKRCKVFLSKRQFVIMGLSLHQASVFL